MVVLNGMSRYHLCIEALRRVGRRLPQASELIEECRASLARHELYTRAHLEDMPEVSGWVWSDA
jgi:xylulose-5-phosphate/fructose-6-phosphate phosphoketolase